MYSMCSKHEDGHRETHTKKTRPSSHTAISSCEDQPKYSHFADEMQTLLLTMMHLREHKHREFFFGAMFRKALGKVEVAQDVFRTAHSSETLI